MEIYEKNLLLGLMAEIKEHSKPKPVAPLPLQPVLDLVQGLSLAWQRFQQEQASAIGLKRNSFLVLALVGRAGERGTTVSRVAGELSVRPQGLSASVAELNRAGLIQRSRDQEDGRSHRLQVTDLGLSLLTKAADMTLDLAEEIARQIPQSSLARLILDRMVRSYNISLSRISASLPAD